MADRVLVAVRKRQIGQIDLVLSRNGRTSSNAPRQFDRIERCGSITPLGAPPVPEV